MKNITVNGGSYQSTDQNEEDRLTDLLAVALQGNHQPAQKQ